MKALVAAGLALLVAAPLWGAAADEAPGARLRVLDKLTGQVTDLDLARGQDQTVGRLGVTLHECRYPANNPTADAYAHLTLTDAVQGGAIFQGWMLASSPALNALDNPRYDVWVLECLLPEGVGEIPEGEAPATEDGDG